MPKTILDFVDTANIRTSHVTNVRVQEFHQAIPGLSRAISDEAAKQLMTAAEWQEYVSVRTATKAGRLPAADIDLYSLLSMRRKDGLPLWSLVNPKWSTGNVNGGCWSGSWLDPSRYSRFVTLSNQGSCLMLNIDKRTERWMSPHDLAGRSRSPLGGFPILPPRIRELLQSEAVQNCSAAVILYQPNAWSQVVHKAPNPDPALLIKRHAEQPFQCLAVWGHDGPLIHEFML